MLKDTIKTKKIDLSISKIRVKLRAKYDVTLEDILLNDLNDYLGRNKVFEYEWYAMKEGEEAYHFKVAHKSEMLSLSEVPTNLGYVSNPNFKYITHEH